MSFHAKPFKILSLDGGGVRSMLEAEVLQRICDKLPGFIDTVDMFAGASAGSIMSAGLAIGLSPSEVASWYEKGAPQVFQRSYYTRVRTLDSAIGALYDTAPLKSMLQTALKDITLRDLKKHFLVPAFKLDASVATPSSTLALSPSVERAPILSTISKLTLQPPHSTSTSSPAPQPLAPGIQLLEEKADVVMKREVHPQIPSTAQVTQRWAPELFHNFPHSTNADSTLVDVCLRSGAAPTFFPIYQGYVDGGMFANNPTLMAVSTAVASGIPMEDIIVLSLSTGFNPSCIPAATYGAGNWGMLEWGPHIVDLLLDSSTEAINYQCKCLLADRYHRLDPLLPAVMGLDDAAAIPSLAGIAKDLDLAPTYDWLNKYWIKDSKGASHQPPVTTASSSSSAYQCNVM